MTNLKKKKKIKVKRRGRTEKGRREKEREERVEKEKLLSKIYGIRTIGFRRSKRQSWSSHRELRVDTKILKFRQTPRGREFFYLVYF